MLLLMYNHDGLVLLPLSSPHMEGQMSYFLIIFNDLK